MPIIFDTLITKGVRAGQIPARTAEAREWYRNTAKGIRSLSEKKLMSADPSRHTAEPTLGSMYLFEYDPKHKETLPFYDRFPLIFPYKNVKGGFMGLNLHYLPLQLRARLMDGLYEYANNQRYDESTKIRMNYELLRRAGSLKFFEPCVKHYLTKHVRSKFVYVYPSEWDIALFLPVERFEKQSKTAVWADSKSKLGIRR